MRFAASLILVLAGMSTGSMACGSGAAPASDPGAAVDVPAGEPDAGADAGPDAATDRGPADPGGVTDVPADLGAGDEGFPDLAADPGAPDGGVDVPPDGTGTDEGSRPDLGPQLPAGCVTGDFHAYFANLHAHSTWSDGKGTPAEAFAHARDVAGIDIQFITDHLEQLYQIPCLWPNGGWPGCGVDAKAASVPGKFLAGCGFEYGTSIAGLTGHNNVFFPDGLFPCLQLYFTEFYATLAKCEGCVGQFNHPGSTATHTWRQFEYHADTDPHMNLFEFNSDGDPWGLFLEALQKGWHVSPTYNQDNHNTKWGDDNDHRSGLWLTDLSLDAVQVAMRERRTFSTEDRNATLAMTTGEGCWMGSILRTTGTLKITVEAVDPDAGDGFATVAIHAPDGTAVVTTNCAGATTCQAQWTIATNEPTYVIPRAVQVDGSVLIGAPLWAGPPAP